MGYFKTGITPLDKAFKCITLDVNLRHKNNLSRTFCAYRTVPDVL